MIRSLIRGSPPSLSCASLRGRLSPALLLALLASSVAPPALAADESSSSSELMFQIVNLLLLLAVLIYFFRAPVRGFFNQRRERIRGELRRASELLEEAQTRFGTWQRRLVDLDAELGRLRTKARQRAEEERERILRGAEASAERIRREAIGAVEQELRRAREELREEAADLAIELAGELLSEEVTDTDRDRLVDEFTDRIERSPAINGGSEA